jgi:hypothetical protein
MIANKMWFLFTTDLRIQFISFLVDEFANHHSTVRREALILRSF